MLIFTLCPTITADENCLTARTSTVAAFLTLGLRLRGVRIDRQTRAVTIHDRIAWFLQRFREIPFAHVAAVTYGYEEFPISFSNARDPVDRFIVGLRPTPGRGKEIKLFSFIGDGAFTNQSGLPDWWYWDEILFDYTGPQEQESRAFVQLLSKLISAPV